MKNDNIINSVTGKVSLFNKHDCYSDEGSALSRDFDELIRRFVNEAHEKYSSQEIDNILTTCVQMLCCDARITRSVTEAKKKMKTQRNDMYPVALEEMEGICETKSSKYWNCSTIPGIKDFPYRIPIIKRIRNITNWGLRETKEFVEDYLALHVGDE